jgi:hypothetical protein
MGTDNKIWFGNYANLYRSATRTLKTDWVFEVGYRLVVDGEFRPKTDYTGNIGRSNLRWKKIHLGKDGFSLYDDVTDAYWDIFASGAESRVLSWMYWDEWGVGTTVFDADAIARTMEMVMSVIAKVDNTYDLGRSDKKWRDLFLSRYHYTGNVSSLPTPDSSYRGALVRVEGGSGVADQVCICVKKADDSYGWFDLISGTFVA